MKKVFVPLLLLCALLLTGCKKTVKPFSIEEKYTVTAGFREVSSYDEIGTSIEDKESFIIYVYDAACIMCNMFTPKIEAALNEKHIQAYKIAIGRLQNTPIRNRVPGTPSVLLVKDGKIVKVLDPTSNKDKDYYSTKDTFISWLAKYIIEAKEGD